MQNLAWPTAPKVVLGMAIGFGVFVVTNRLAARIVPADRDRQVRP
jgi:hypothetical protein